MWLGGQKEMTDFIYIDFNKNFGFVSPQRNWEVQLALQFFASMD